RGNRLGVRHHRALNTSFNSSWFHVILVSSMRGDPTRGVRKQRTRAETLRHTAGIRNSKGIADSSPRIDRETNEPQSHRRYSFRHLRIRCSASAHWRTAGTESRSTRQRNHHPRQSKNSRRCEQSTVDWRTDSHTAHQESHAEGEGQKEEQAEVTVRYLTQVDRPSLPKTPHLLRLPLRSDRFPRPERLQDA